MPVTNSINNRANASLALPVYSIDNLPSATSNAFEIAFCSPCDDAKQRLIWSDGTNWRYSYSNQIVNTAIQTLTNPLPQSCLDLPVQSPALPSPTTALARIYSENFNGITRIRVTDWLNFTRNISDSYLIVHNGSGSAIAKGQAVYQLGANGSLPSVGLARANSRTTMPCLGLAAENIASGAAGRVITLGLLENVDTSAFSNGAVVWVSNNSSGGLTSNEPSHPRLVQRVGSIVVANATTGSIQVRITSVTGEAQGTLFNTFSIGDQLTGAKNLNFVNTFTGILSWNPTANRAISLPDSDGTLAVTSLFNNGATITGVAASRILYTTGTDAWASTSLTGQGRNLIALSPAANTFPVIGTGSAWTAQAISTTGRAIVNTTIAADQLLYGNGANTFTTTALTAGGRSVIGLALGTALQEMRVNSTGTGVEWYTPNPEAPAGAVSVLVARAVATSNIVLSGIQTIDGVVLVAGDKVLTTAQTTTSDNRLWTVASGAWTAATELDSNAEIFQGLLITVLEGTINANSSWSLATPNPTIGVALDWRVQSVNATRLQGRRISNVNPIDKQGLVYNGTSGLWVPTTLPEVLTTEANYYVSTTGSDTANTGKTSGSPFRTIQKAVDVACQVVNYSGININIADGTYAESVQLKRYVGSGSLRLIGNTSSASSVVIASPNSNPSITTDGGFGVFVLDGIRLNNANAGRALQVRSGCMCVIKRLNIGVCSDGIAVARGGTVDVYDPTLGTGVTQASTSINFLGNVSGSGILCRTNSLIMLDANVTIAFGASVSVNTLFYLDLNGQAVISATFSGTFTGTKYSVTQNSLLSGVSNATIPGSINGTADASSLVL